MKDDDARARPARRTAKSAARRVGFATTTRTAREVEDDVASSDPDSQPDRARSARRSGEPARVPRSAPRRETQNMHPPRGDVQTILRDGAEERDDAHVPFAR